MLIEVGYITNQQERRKPISPAYQQELAEAVADGLTVYWQKKHLLRLCPAQDNHSR